jgi:hypothetical protein
MNGRSICFKFICGWRNPGFIPISHFCDSLMIDQFQPANRDGRNLDELTSNFKLRVTRRRCEVPSSRRKVTPYLNGIQELYAKMGLPFQTGVKLRALCKGSPTTKPFVQL